MPQRISTGIDTTSTGDDQDSKSAAECEVCGPRELYVRVIAHERTDSRARIRIPGVSARELWTGAAGPQE